MKNFVTVNSEQFSARPKVPIKINGPMWAVCYAYYAFIFSIPFEEADIGIGSGYFAVSKMIGYIFILLVPLQPRLCFRSPPRAFWCFAIYLCVYVILGVYVMWSIPQEPEFMAQMIGRLFTLIQVLILFWISYNLMRYERVIKGTLLMLAASCVVLAVLQALGITSETEAQDRVSAFGTNPNTLGALLALGLLALVGLAYGRKEIDNKVRLLMWLSGGILAIATIRTGSRGAMTALVVGLLFFSLKGRSVLSMLKVGLIVIPAISSLLWVSYHSEAVRRRWEQTFLKGSLAGREDILPEAWEMFKEKPLIGWGPVYHYVELGSRFGVPAKDTHNLYLWILTETGLLGAIPFFVGLWFCWRAAWRARRSIQGVLPIAMLSCLLTINMSGTWHNRKPFWIVLAYALVSSSYVVPPWRWRQRAQLTSADSWTSQPQFHRPPPRPRVGVRKAVPQPYRRVGY